MTGNEFDRLEGGHQGGKDKSSQAIESLENDLVAERESRREERFMWIVVLVVLANVIFLRDFNNWTGPIVIGVLQLIGLLVAARWFGVEEVQMFFDKVLQNIKPSSN